MLIFFIGFLTKNKCFLKGIFGKIFEKSEKIRKFFKKRLKTDENLENMLF